MRRIAFLVVVFLPMLAAGCSSVGWNVSIYAGAQGNNNSEFEHAIGYHAGVAITFSNRTPIPVSPNINQTVVRVNNNVSSSSSSSSTQNQNQNQNNGGQNGGNGHGDHRHHGHGNGHDCDSDD